jgi:hypothetical protein
MLAAQMNRHAFWCGHSGSGKTHALGVLFEYLLWRTRLPLVIVAPNSDFVRMPEVRAEADEKDVRTLQSRDIRVFLSVSGDHRVKVRFHHMALSARAPVLQIDPLRDADEFDALVKMEPAMFAGFTVPLTEWSRSIDNPVRHRIVHIAAEGRKYWSLAADVDPTPV